MFKQQQHLRPVPRHRPRCWRVCPWPFYGTGVYGPGVGVYGPGAGVYGPGVYRTGVYAPGVYGPGAGVGVPPQPPTTVLLPPRLKTTTEHERRRDGKRVCDCERVPQAPLTGMNG
ncbi:hypothetical protein PF003_g21648 [Phytophthora fragariae]|nr:hypothetical protein PF003_g21648 [Phytophthora fragariae]